LKSFLRFSSIYEEPIIENNSSSSWIFFNKIDTTSFDSLEVKPTFLKLSGAIPKNW